MNVAFADKLSDSISNCLCSYYDVKESLPFA